MRSDFYIEYHRTYLLVQHTPNFELTAEAMNNFWLAVAPACYSLNCKRVLWEGKVAACRMNMSEVYDSAAKAGQVALGLKLACLFENHLPDERTVLFKSVALRKGAMVEYFSTRAEALTWLGVDPALNRQLTA